MLEPLTYSDASQNLSLPEIFRKGRQGRRFSMSWPIISFTPKFKVKISHKKKTCCYAAWKSDIPSPNVDLYQLYPIIGATLW